MPLLTPNVPKGLIDLMKSLTKEVLRDKPENIYEYAVVHFEKQLCERDGSLDKDYELFTEYKASLEGHQQFVIPAGCGFKCQRTPRGSGSRRSKPDILANFKVMESIHEEDASAEAPYSDEKYQKAIYVIQRYYRRYMANKKLSRQRLTEATAAIIIQRTMRKLFASKFPSRPGGETVRHGEVPQEDVDNVSEAASYTSSSTIQMLAESQEGRENRLTTGREEIADDNGVSEGDGSTTVTHEPQSNHIVAVKEKPAVVATPPASADRKSMDHQNDDGLLLPHEEIITNPAATAAVVSDDTSTAPIGILSTKIGSNDQQNSVQTNPVEVAKNSKNSEPTHEQRQQDAPAPVEMYSLESPQSLGSTPETPPVAPPTRQSSTEKTFAVRLQSNAFVDNNAGYSMQSVGPNRKFAPDTGDSLRAYSVFYQDGDDPDFSDSLNESTMEKDSLDTEDLDVDSLESNENTSHVSGIVKRESMQVAVDRRDGGTREEDDNEEQQLTEVERVPSYLYGIHPKRIPLPERKSVPSRTTLDGERFPTSPDDKGPDEKSEEVSLESKESTSEESSATQIENVLEPKVDDMPYLVEDAHVSNCQDELLKTRSGDEGTNRRKSVEEVAGKDEAIEDKVGQPVIKENMGSPSSSGVVSSSDHDKPVGYFENLYNIDNTVQSSSGHKDTEVELQLKDLRSLCNLYPGLEIKDIISEFHTKHIQPEESGKDSTCDDNNNVEDFEMKSSDNSPVDEDADAKAFEELCKVVGGEKANISHFNASKTIDDVFKKEESVNEVSAEVVDGNEGTVDSPPRDRDFVVVVEGVKEEKKNKEKKNGPICGGIGANLSTDQMKEHTTAAEPPNQTHDSELAVSEVNSELSDETDINKGQGQRNVTSDGMQAAFDKELISGAKIEMQAAFDEELISGAKIDENHKVECRNEDKAEDAGTKEEVELELVKTSASATEAKAPSPDSDEVKKTFGGKSAEPKESRINGSTNNSESGNMEAKLIAGSEAEEKYVDDSYQEEPSDKINAFTASNEGKADKNILFADTSVGGQEVKRSEHIENLDEIQEKSIETTGGSEEEKSIAGDATESLTEEKTVGLEHIHMQEGASEAGGLNEENGNKEGSSRKFEVNAVAKDDIPKEQELKSSLSEQTDVTAEENQSVEERKEQHDLEEATIAEMKFNAVEGGTKDTELKLQSDKGDALKQSNESDAQSIENQEEVVRKSSDQIVESPEKLNEESSKKTAMTMGQMGGLKVIESSEKIVDSEAKGGEQVIEGDHVTKGDLNENEAEEVSSKTSPIQENEGTGSDEIAKSSNVENMESVEIKVPSDVFEDKGFKEDRGNSSEQENSQELDLKTKLSSRMSISAPLQETLVRNQEGLSESVDLTDAMIHEADENVNLITVESKDSESSSRDKEAGETELPEITRNDDVQHQGTTSNAVPIGEISRDEDLRDVESKALSSADQEVDDTFATAQPKDVDSELKINEEVRGLQLKSEEEKPSNPPRVEKTESQEDSLTHDRGKEVIDETGLTEVLRSFKDESHPSEEEATTYDRAKEGGDETGLTGVLRSFKDDARPHDESKDNVHVTGLTGVLRSFKDDARPQDESKDNDDVNGLTGALRSFKNDVHPHDGSKIVADDTGLTGVLRSIKDESHPREEEGLTQDGAKEGVEKSGLAGVLRSFKDDARRHDESKDGVDMTGLSGALRSFKEVSHPSEEEATTHDGVKEGGDETGLTGALRTFKDESHPNEEEATTHDRAKEGVDETGLTVVLRSLKDESHPREEEVLTQDGAKEGVEETGLTGVLRSVKDESHLREEEALNHDGGKDDVDETHLTGVLMSFKDDAHPRDETKEGVDESGLTEVESKNSDQNGQPLMDMSSATETYEVGTTDIKRNKRSLSNGNFNEELTDEHDTTIDQSGGLGEQSAQLSEHPRDLENDRSLLDTALVKIILTHAEDSNKDATELELGHEEDALPSEILNSNIEDDSPRNVVKSEDSSVHSANTEKLDVVNEIQAGGISENNTTTLSEEHLNCTEKKDNASDTLPSKEHEDEIVADKDGVPSEGNDFIESAQINTEGESKPVGNGHNVNVLSVNVHENEDGIVGKTVIDSTKCENQERNTTAENAEMTTVVRGDPLEVDSTSVVENPTESEESTAESSNRGDGNEQIMSGPLEDVNSSEEAKASKSESKRTESTPEQDLNQQENTGTNTLGSLILKEENKIGSLAETIAELHEISPSSASNHDYVQEITSNDVFDVKLKEKLQEAHDDETNERARQSQSVPEYQMLSTKDEAGASVADEDRKKGNAEIRLLKMDGDTSRGDVETVNVSEKEDKPTDDSNPSRSVDNMKDDLQTESKVKYLADEMEQNIKDEEKTSTGTEEIIVEPQSLQKPHSDDISAENDVDEARIANHKNTEVEASSERHDESIERLDEDNVVRSQPKWGTESITSHDTQANSNESEDKAPKESTKKEEEKQNATKYDPESGVAQITEIEAKLSKDDKEAQNTASMTQVIFEQLPKEVNKNINDKESDSMQQSELEIKENHGKNLQTNLIQSESSKDEAEPLLTNQSQLGPSKTTQGDLNKPATKDDPEAVPKEDHAKSTASGPSTEVTSVDENTGDTSADFSSLGKDLDFFEDTIHYLKSATSQLTAIGGLFEKTNTDTPSTTEENLNKAAVVIQSAMRGFRVRRAFKRNLSARRKQSAALKRVETEGTTSIPVAIIHPTKHLTENETTSGVDASALRNVGQQANETKPEDENVGQHGVRSKDSEIPRLRREKPLERKTKVDENSAKIQPVKAKSLEGTQQAKPRLTREKPIETNPKSLKGDSLDETTPKETMRGVKTGQKTPFAKDKTKIPNSRVVSSSNVPERHRLIKSKRDQFAKKGKSFSTNAQTQKPLVFDLEAIKKDLLLKKTVPQAVAKKTRTVTRKGIDLKREAASVDKLNDTSVDDQSKVQESRADEKEDDLEKGSGLEESSYPKEDLAQEGAMESSVDLGTVEMLVQEALIDQNEGNLVQQLQSTVDKENPINEFVDKNEQLTDESTQDNLNETSIDSGITSTTTVLKEALETQPDLAEGSCNDRTESKEKLEEVKQESLNEQSHNAKSDHLVKGMSQEISKVTPSAEESSELNNSDGNEFKGKTQGYESSTIVIADLDSEDNKTGTTLPQIIIHHTSDSRIHSPVAVDALKEEEGIKDSKKDQDEHQTLECETAEEKIKELIDGHLNASNEIVEGEMSETTNSEENVETTLTSTEITPDAQKDEGNFVFVTDATSGVDQITKNEAKLSKEDKDEEQHTSPTTQVISEQLPKEVNSENMNDKESDSMQQNELEIKENHGQNLQTSLIQSESSKDEAEPLRKNQSQLRSLNTTQGDLNKPAIMIQKTFRGYNTRKTLNGKNAKNINAADQENCKSTEVHDSVDSTSHADLDTSATIIQKNYRGYRARRSLKDVPQVDVSNSPQPSQSTPSIECVEPPKLDDSAVMIQKTFRGYRTRKELTERQNEKANAMNEAAVVIQKSYKGYKTRKDLQKETETNCQSEDSRERAATLIQKTYKGYKTRVDLQKCKKQHDDAAIEPSDNAAPHFLKSTSAHALLESAAETIQKAYRDYHGRNGSSFNEAPIKSYSHGAQRDHASREAVENSDESSTFIGPDTSFDLSDVESVETRSEQVSDTATFTLQDENPGHIHSPEEPQQPESNTLAVASEIRRKTSIIEPTAPALEDILKSDEPSGSDRKPQWYVGDDLIVPTDAQSVLASQQNSLNSTSSSRFDNSCSTDAHLDISDKQPTPSIQSAVVSTSSLLIPNDTEIHHSDAFKQFTKPSRAVSADEEEESSAREDEENEKEIEQNAEEQKLDAVTARDRSEYPEKDLSELPIDDVREIEAEVCKSCAEGMHGAGLTTASPRRKSIEEISREIDEQATNVNDTKDDTADDSGDENLDKMKQFVPMEEDNKANITESHISEQCENTDDNNCNKSHNDPDVADLDELNKVNIKDATSDSKISGIPSEGGKEQQEAFVENALKEDGHECVDQGVCPAIALIPPSSEDDVSDKAVSEGEANEELSKKTESGTGADEAVDLRNAAIDVSPSQEAAVDEKSVVDDESQEENDAQKDSAEQSEVIKIEELSHDTSGKINDRAEDHNEDSGSVENVSSTVDKKAAVEEALTSSEVKDEAREGSSDLKAVDDVEAEETSGNETQTKEIANKENSEKDPIKEVEEPVTRYEAAMTSSPNDEDSHSNELKEDSPGSSREIHSKDNDESNQSTSHNNNDGCPETSAAEAPTEGVADSAVRFENEKALEIPPTEDKDSASLNVTKEADESQSNDATCEPTEDECAPPLLEKKPTDDPSDVLPQTKELDSTEVVENSSELSKNEADVENSKSTKEDQQGQSEAKTESIQAEGGDFKSSQDQEVLSGVDSTPAEQNKTQEQEKKDDSHENEPTKNTSKLEEKLEKLIDDSSPLTNKDSISVEPQSLPTENSSQEVVEEPCIKKVAPSFPRLNASEQEDSEIESTTTKAESTTTSVAYDEPSENETLDSPPSLHDTLEKATEALRESEAVVARMHLRRDSEQRASIDHVEQFPVFGDLACEPVKPMQELQKPSSPETEDDLILQGLQRGDTTRESSAQSESIIFGNSSTQLSESDEFSNETFDSKTMHRMNTIAVDHGTYKAPGVLFKSVTIDDTVKYIDPVKSTEESGDSFCLDDALTADVRKKIMAYSVSEADSDYYEPGERGIRLRDDFNISTALNKFASSDTDTTIISAATKIQAGARGFLTRRRLRRASMGTRASLTDGTKASFGNDAIGESLDRLVEEEANRRLPKVHYQRQVGVNSLPSALTNTDEPEIVHSTPTRDELSTLTATTELLAPSSADTPHGEPLYGQSVSTSSEYDVNGGIGASIDESSERLSSNLEATLAARRLTLQRGDAMRNDSTPDYDNGNDKQVEQAKFTATANTDAILIHESTLVESTTTTRQTTTTTTTTTNTEKRAHSDAAMARRMEKIKWFAMRQNSMPVQIDSEVFRVLPKHMRKRIKSAEGQQKKRIRLPRD